MSMPNDDVLARELAYEAVNELAPAETTVFDAVAKPYLEDPDRMARVAETDSPLGSGIETIAALLTPAAVLVASAVLAQIASRVGDSAFYSGQGWLKRRFRRDRKPLSVPRAQLQKLTADDLAAIREIAVQKAVTLKLDAQTATTLADSIVGAIVRRSAG